MNWSYADMPWHIGIITDLQTHGDSRFRLFSIDIKTKISYAFCQTVSLSFIHLEKPVAKPCFAPEFGGTEISGSHSFVSVTAIRLHLVSCRFQISDWSHSPRNKVALQLVGCWFLIAVIPPEPTDTTTFKF